jgi:hypothetical protein
MNYPIWANIGWMVVGRAIDEGVSEKRVGIVMKVRSEELDYKFKSWDCEMLQRLLSGGCTFLPEVLFSRR